MEYKRGEFLMFLTKCGVITDELFENYLDRLVPRFFKILALNDEQNPTLIQYIKSFQRELVGSKNLVNVLNNDARFLTLISTLQYFIDNGVNNSEVKKCISISKQLKEHYFPNNKKGGL